MLLRVCRPVLSHGLLLTVLSSLAIGSTGVALAQSQANYDEARVPRFTLPDPLVSQDGQKIDTPELWTQKRRPELLELCRREVYGRAPGRPEAMTFERTSLDEKALGGIAVRKEVSISFAGHDDGPRLDVLLYLPADKVGQGPIPVFLGLNFQGNHSINADPGIALCKSWMRPGTGVVDHAATEEARGVAASRWPIEMILKRGYGLVTCYYGDIDPDFHDGFKNGVHALYPTPDGRKPDAWGSIAAWAWGLSRIMDYLETDRDVDAAHVALLGHSRLGKTSLWAGAEDRRFAMVISNNSGCGGAALSRRAFGETVARINTSFPHWFCENFQAYNGAEDKLPVDQHQLIALIAPRPCYVASAEDDRWADPRGEFLSTVHAGPVYRLLGARPLPTDQMPETNRPLTATLGYHIRTGKHDVTDYDWRQYLDFADLHFGRE